ncbi:MAG: preprotein translocase subunit SecG [Chlorobium sp.]|jgi:preprotein translocase subunit SecG|uniref:preprotein translocase subunit SecG n=1 Tax=Chlorobium sp. TaxID=1095 RepID=UPI001D58B9BE|nr:preprotein translocase subunit SecG [Chlorobium sp.]MBN1279465.1 preprotein translocase subunit SecG [Chlorobiaceae bacterium]MCF8216512.1 preprotein translocase subunit SecG [Chlorobium sp.]MCF8271417.1 preprotein translocase subunit SecG [Chlorobium sp.]MCF8287789.1 preprotein translocase subunit SecG [Chlorobium sp.]MCF8291328.1 preprotein translocase subunit SecG [Chlorobium sp.]
MHVFLLIIGLLASILLIGSILLQSPKSGSGLTGGIASLGTVQTLGVRRTGDFLSKVTAGLAAVVMIAAFLAQFTMPAREARKKESKSILQQSAPLPVQAPMKTAPVLPKSPATPVLPAAPPK